MATKRPEEAEQPLKVVAEISQSPAARFQLAEYYLNVGRNEEATKLLTELAANQATFADAEAMLASIDYDGGRREEAHARLDKLLARAPKDARALVMKARWLTNEKKLDEALDRAKAAVAADPQSAPAHYALGMVHDLRREVPDAIKAYNEVLRLNPRAVAAQVELSRLNLATGDRDAALHYAEEAKQTAAGECERRAWRSRGACWSGEISDGRRPRSRSFYAACRTQRLFTRSTACSSSGATTMRRREHPSSARSQLTPGNFEAIAGLVGLDLQAKQFDAAVSRIDAELTKQPDRVELLALAGAGL